MNYYAKLIDFFKKHGIDNDKMFRFIRKRTKEIDYSIEEQREIRGAFPIYNKQKEIIDFVLYIDTKSEKTILLNIRPFIKAICLYIELKTEYNLEKDIESEILAIYYEKQYLKENPNKQSEDYLNNIYANIKNEDDNSKHKIALSTEEELEKISSDKMKFNELHEKAKSLRKTKSKQE